MKEREEHADEFVARVQNTTGAQRRRLSPFPRIGPIRSCCWAPSPRGGLTPCEAR